MSPFWHCWWLESNLVQFVEKPWGKIISVTLCGDFFFFFFAFWWNFLSCKYYDVFLLLLLLFSLFFSDWSTTLWISAHPQPHSSSTSYQTPQSSQMSYFHVSFSGRRRCKIDIFIRFCTWLKRRNCAKSLSTQNYHTNVLLNVLWVVEQRKDI